jgi:hypothetical protein
MIPSNVLLDSKKAEGDIWSTQNLCSAICHEGEYSRTPGGLVEEIVDMVVWTTDGDCESKDSFSPGEPVHYHLSFYLTGPFADAPWCVKTKENYSAAYHLPYQTGWMTPVVMEPTLLPQGQHSMCWDMTIPSDAEPGPAEFYMQLQMGTPDCLELLDSDTQVHPFDVE